ncbi:3D (Asp-Asp-Asp) domain-containing protein [Marinococcus luteus]|uniref:3D (Asp-Asp-Asp) domain-containing protein n=1 Tax=Marinococcus luteus TaxID=1122204 RepID=A0A1H2RRN5_9BACI|nr:3D domain-containing protein [Marinococcus luteus]SDW21444.1 3D (Asp-Asp-Asp) domain-containing protein [Marinococcus luteus]
MMKKTLFGTAITAGVVFGAPQAADASISDHGQMDRGDVNSSVAELQDTLKEKGYFHGNTGSTFGPRTESAVKDFQADNGISSSAGNYFGVAGPETQAALGGSSDSSSEEVAGASTSESSDSTSGGETMTVEATAYTAECVGCSGITATGVNLNNDRDANVIAVDPDVIPLGSTVEVEGMGTYKAEDTGGAINGNRIDVHVPTNSEALSFGRQDVEVTVVD